MKKLLIVLMLFLVWGCASKEPKKINPAYKDATYGDFYLASQNGTSQRQLIEMSEAIRLREKTERERTENKALKVIDHIITGVTNSISL